MKERSRYFVINPDQKQKEHKDEQRMINKLEAMEDYTDGFYSSSSENQNSEDLSKDF